MSALSCAEIKVVRPTPGGGERIVLAGVSLSFAPGRIALVSGATGAGKTTLLHVLAGLLRPTAGEVRVGDQPVSRWTSAHKDLWRREVGLLFQTLHLFDGLTALENVMVPLVPRAPSVGELRRAGRRALEEAGAAHLAGREGAGLSGGERQRVCLARALVGRPAFLLLDEPTAHQDEEGVACVLACLAAARDRGAVVVVSSHDPRFDEHDLDADRWILQNGLLVPA